MFKLVCTINILDEVNIKLSGLDPATRRECVNALKFKLPGARFIRSVRLGRWDGTVSLCTAGGGTYLNLFPILHPIIEKHGYTFEINDERIPHNFSFEQIDKNFWGDKTWGQGHRLEGQPIVLEDHQVQIVNEFLNNHQGVIEAATSAGKTVIACTLSKITEQYGRSIVIVPSKDLVLQTEEDYKNLGMDVGVFYGKRKEINKKHIICTWQSLSRLDQSSKDALSEIEISEFLNDVIMVLVDECHLAAAKVLTSLLSDPFKNVPLRWGLTGTVPLEAHLKTTIQAVIGNTLLEVSATDLQEKGFLAECNINIEQYETAGSSHTDWHSEEEHLSSDATILRQIAERIIEISNTGNTFVLVNRREAGLKLMKLIPNSVYLNGSNKAEDRKKEYSEMNSEDHKVIIATFGIASTGINIPRIFNLVLFNPGKSFIRTIQSIGRGLRKARDKNAVNIFDFCFMTKYSKRHLTTRKKYYEKAGYPFKIKKIAAY